jgi:two-component system nitrogen regulation sensor histidine kinase GlnL
MDAPVLEDIKAIQLLDALPHPMVLIAADGEIRYANQACEIFFKSSVGFICRRKIDYFLPFGSPVLALVDQVRKENSVFNEYKIDISSPRLGREKVVDVFGSPFPEKPDHVILQFMQQSAAEKLDRQLTHRSAARTVTGLASMLAHEIKNPLSGIRGAAQLLEMSGNDEDRALTQLIKDETDRIVKLVDRMEVFSDDRPMEKQPVNIHAVLEHVKRIAENGFGSEVKFSELYDPSLPPVMGNRDQLVQVFLNLVKNAVEGTQGKQSREIRLSTGFRSGVHLSIPGAGERIALPVELCIHDNGTGIPDEIRQWIFDPFITTKTNGSGLGLALVAKIVGDHGGMIEVDSDSQGTTFRILLPVYKLASGAFPDERELT